MEIIKRKISEQLTEFLNVHWEYSRLELSKFSQHTLYNPSESVDFFLKHLNNHIQMLEKNVPIKIRLGIFEIELTKIKQKLLDKARDLYE